MNPWVAIIAQYGIEFAIELAQMISDKTDPTPDDFRGLKTKWTSKTPDDFLKEAAAAPVVPTPPGT